MSNKRATIPVLLLVLAAIVAGATLAWLSDTKEDKLHFTYAASEHPVKIELAEPSWSPDPESQFSGVTAQKPAGGWGRDIALQFNEGRRIPKDPTVKSVGEIPCYVGIRVSTPKSSSIDMHQMLSIFDVDWPGENSNWEYIGQVEDGSMFFVYNKALDPGEPTEPLFTRVMIKERKAANAAAFKILEGKDSKVDMLVEAYSVQADNASDKNWSPRTALQAEFTAGVNEVTHWDAAKKLP